MKKKTKNGGSGAAELAVAGAAIAGLAATAYFFLGPKGKTHQKHAKAWAVKMKHDVVKKLKTARAMGEPAYQEIIDSVASEYEKGKIASHAEIEELAKDLKKHWKTISTGVRTAKRDAVKGVGKVAKKAGL